MAMISTSKRNFYDYLNETNKKNKNTEGIGPGTYSPKPFDKSIAYKNVRPPPFNTQDQKWSPDKSALKSNIPGPGAYSVAGDMNKGRVIAINPEKGTYYIQDPSSVQKKLYSMSKNVNNDRLNMANKNKCPGPGAYEQESTFDKMKEYERIRRKKKGSYSVNPTLSHVITSNSTLNYKDGQTNDSTIMDNTSIKANWPMIDNSSPSNSNIMKLNSSKGSLSIPNRDGNMFGKSERKLDFGYSNPKTGPGSYVK